jgi:DnaK suppressor protein
MAAKKKSTRRKTAKKKATRKKVAKKPVTKKTSGKTSRKTSKKTPSKTVKKTPTRKKVAKKVTKKTSKRAAGQTAKKSTQLGTVADDKGFKPYQPKRGEEYMNEGQQEHFRKILLSWKRELMEEVDRTVHHMQDEAANFPDPSDRATQESEFSLELRTRDRERKLIKKIDEALRSIESGDYGFCESCGVEIGIRRLEARPTATLCIDCKTLDEIRERQMIG